LLAIGFESRGNTSWLCPYGLSLSVATKANSVAECSADPFQVPWNFEARQWEILGPFLMDMQNAATDSNKPILEVGCGFGKNAVLLEECNLEVYGIDLAVDAVRQCRRWVRHPARFVVGAVGALPYPDGS